MLNSSKIFLYTDGASLGNPGKAGVAFVLYTPEHKLVKKASSFIGEVTNNVAEYLALIYGMQEALRAGARELVCYSDSELMVRQLTGRYRVRSKTLMLFFRQVRHLEGLFDRVKFNYISRDHNTEADKLAKKAAREAERMGSRGGVSPEESPGT